MSKILKRTKAGRLVSAVLYTAPASGDPPKARAQKQKASTWAREKLNARTSFQKLERKLAANFDNGDLFVTLTYDDKHLPKDRSQAVRCLKRFFGKLSRARGQPLRYIYVTEGCFPGGRLHHHIVINSTGDDLELIRKLWLYGDNVEVQRLTFDQDYTYEDLASYLTKEPREWGHPKIGEHTWTPSRGLVSPEPETERVADDLMLGVPPGALVLDREGPRLNGWGEFSWVKCLLPYTPRKKKRAKRKRPKKE